MVASQQPVEPGEIPDSPPGVAETRARILQTAADCFTRYGFARTRMDDVAAGAGVSRALVYDYFSSKQKLLVAVQRAALDEWFASYETVIADSVGARDALAAWLSFCLTPSDRHDLARAVFAADAVESAGGWTDWRAQLRDEWLARLTALLERGIENGEFRSGLDAPATALTLRGLQLGVTQQMLGDGPPTAIKPERQIEAAVDLMLAGLSTPHHNL
jgi:AcrR family transcriptional regulator